MPPSYAPPSNRTPKTKRVVCPRLPPVEQDARRSWAGPEAAADMLMSERCGVVAGRRERSQAIGHRLATNISHLRYPLRTFPSNSCSELVGVEGVEPPASCASCMRSNQLSYTPEPALTLPAPATSHTLPRLAFKDGSRSNPGPPANLAARAELPSQASCPRAHRYFSPARCHGRSARP